MPTLYEFSKQIAELKNDRKYHDVLTYFKSNKTGFSDEEISSNQYIVADILSCLRYTSQYEAGFRFMDIYRINVNPEQNERILTAYGWLLWSYYKSEQSAFENTDDDDNFAFDDAHSTNIHDFGHSKDETIDRIEHLISILNSIDSEYVKTLSSNLFNIVLKLEKRKASTNWRLINEFCDNIDPESLSRKCTTIQVERKNKFRDMELASDFETWYAYKTQALLKLGQWQQCFEMSKTALEVIEQFHYSNDVWFSRRIALSKKSLGDTDDTIRELQAILRKKREWFIQKELSEIYFENGDHAKSLRLAIEAMNNFGPLEFKIDLLLLLGDILSNQNEGHLAFKHYSLSKLLREEQEWRVPDTLTQKLQTAGGKEIGISHLPRLKRELKDYWQGFNGGSPTKARNSKPASDAARLEGMVSKILHDNPRGKVGFVRKDGIEYYFSVPATFFLTSQIQTGSKVEFRIQEDNGNGRKQIHILKILKNAETES